MTLKFVRAFILFIFVLGAVGSAFHLLLLGHVSGTLQLVPLVLIVLALGTLLWYGAAHSKRSIRMFRLLMGLFLLAGFIGMALHFRGSLHVELARSSTIGGWRLFWESLRGQYPLLSPGWMVLLGLIGGVYTFRHPVLLGRRALSTDLEPDRTG
jgi:hypothetical protein